MIMHERNKLQFIMKVIYVAPRFHTNQVPIMKGWLEAGDEVKFISQYAGGTEDYSVIEPTILGYSFVFRVILFFYRQIQKLRGKYRENDYNFQAKFGFLPRGKFKKIIKDFQPDVVIIRDRSLYNISITGICKKKNICCILYTQTPLWEPVNEKNDIVRRYFRSHTPALRMTPVLGEVKKEGTMVKEGSFYIPFVIEPELHYEDKVYPKDKPIRLLDVGKYEKRKHHEYLLQLAAEHKDKQDVHVTIIGEAVTKEQLTFLDTLKAFTKEKGIEEMVDFKQNLRREEVGEAYKEADVFLLPSTGEFASVSQLEAMSYSLPVMVSSTNGTACYVEHEGNGYIFEDNNYDDFKKYAELLLEPSRIETMGKRSYELVEECYSFPKYKEAVLRICEEWKK